MRTLAIILLCLCIPLSGLHADGIPKYKRSYFGDWADSDGDCQNTRHELLQELSTAIMSFTDNTCRVLTGKWQDPYTGKTFRRSDKVDIDHMVPLYWAWQHGAHSWNRDKRVRFANDPRNLFAVQKSVNREKSAKGPLKWLPPNIAFRCNYIIRFERILKIYDLRMSNYEQNGFKILKAQYC